MSHNSAQVVMTQLQGFKQLEAIDAAVSGVNSEEQIGTVLLNDAMYDWHKKYPEYTAENIETKGVLKVINRPFCFVDHEHPVVDLIRNCAEFGICDIDAQKKLDDRYFKVSNNLLRICCDTIKKNIFVE